MGGVALSFFVEVIRLLWANTRHSYLWRCIRRKLCPLDTTAPHVRKTFRTDERPEEVPFGTIVKLAIECLTTCFLGEPVPSLPGQLQHNCAGIS